MYAWVLGYGYYRLASPPAEQGRLRVALVQANIAQEDKWDAEKLLGNIERHMAQTHDAAARGARLVVWPESAVGFHYDDTPPVAEALDGLARQLGLYLLFGNDDREGFGPDERSYVGAKLLTPEGRLALRYHKLRLVPFGEYVPLQPLLTLGGRYGAKLVQQVSDFTPGEAALVARVDERPLSVMICYEAIFPDLGRRFAANGAGLLVNITNDAWYGRTSAPHQHLAMASFRAVENGIYLVRAANTGISAVVDARGRILERTSLFERATLVRDVPILAADTFYARHGDVFGLACVLLTLIATGVALWPQRVMPVTGV
jgi:apolipoprotein N-acyltransferase